MPSREERRQERQDAYARKRARQMEAYARRNRLLAEMGYDSYADYLRSELWAEIRAKVLDRDHGLCVTCRRPATQAHHCYYSREVLEGRRLDSVVAICAGCHVAIEFDRGTKAAPARASQKLRRRAKRKAKARLWSHSPEYRAAYRELAEARALPEPARRPAVAAVRKKMRAIVKQEVRQPSDE